MIQKNYINPNVYWLTYVNKVAMDSCFKFVLEKSDKDFFITANIYLCLDLLAKKARNSDKGIIFIMFCVYFYQKHFLLIQ